MDNNIDQALATLRDYVQRSTHWQEGGADRHAALQALKALDQGVSRVKGAELELTAALGYVDEICMDKEAEVSYETLQRSGFKRKEGWRRKYTLTDARSAARCAAIRLRNAWQLLDPIDQCPKAEASRTALCNCQDALLVAIDHLQNVLNRPRSHDAQQRADTAARDWLDSIGSEP